MKYFILLSFLFFMPIKLKADTTTNTINYINEINLVNYTIPHYMTGILVSAISRKWDPNTNIYKDIAYGLIGGSWVYLMMQPQLQNSNTLCLALSFGALGGLTTNLIGVKLTF